MNIYDTENLINLKKYLQACINETGEPMFSDFLNVINLQDSKIKKQQKEIEELKSKWINTNDKVPDNSDPVYALQTYRYLRYKPNSQQAKKGIVGRWQEWNGYGFSNCEEPYKWMEQKS